MSKGIAYDHLYKRADKVLKKHDPCKFHTNASGKVQCAAGNPCCNGCKHLGPKGCKVEALACKLWLCWDVQRLSENRECVIALGDLRKEGHALGVPMYYRMSKPENFRP